MCRAPSGGELGVWYEPWEASRWPRRGKSVRMKVGSRYLIFSNLLEDAQEPGYWPACRDVEEEWLLRDWTKSMSVERLTP